MAELREIVVDALHPAKVARFWAAALDGYEVRAYDAAEIARLASLGLTPETDPSVLVDGPGPTLCFQKVTAPKTVENRLHLDVKAADLRGEVERLTRLGGSVKRERADRVVMRDPEGNEFCVVAR